MKAFKERAKCIIDQFSGFEVEKGLNQKGELVMTLKGTNMVRRRPA